MAVSQARTSGTAAANTAVVITLAAIAAIAHAIKEIHASYSGAPTGGLLTIEDGAGNFVFRQYVAAGSTVITFNRPLQGTANTAMIVTLAAGGAGVIGALNVDRTTE